MSPPNALSVTDPAAFAHRYVEGADAFRMIALPRAAHREGPFLSDEYVGARPVLGDVAAEAALALPADPPLHFLFHAAFCGSTQLVSALDRPGLAMGLSEPMLFNDITGLHKRGGSPREVARLADLATRLLGRPFAPGEAVVAKPSNLVNPFAPLLMAVRPGARALFLYAPLETFLVSVARKGLWCRLWVRELLEAFITARGFDLGMTMEDHFRQSDLQVAAVGWLAQLQMMQGLAGRVGPRLASLDSESLLADPARALIAVAGHYGLALDAAAAAEVAAGPAFTRHSKSGADYDPARRAADYAAVRAAHADEIDKVTAWAGSVAGTIGLDLAAPNPLQL
ncbi:MAG: hypothetical protein JSS36_10540 [Proteobacteria bacterium]|nr:hypothetical protein [Pseudomonadota bacterium]